MTHEITPEMWGNMEASLRFVAKTLYQSEHYIRFAFDWAATPQGHDYWERVEESLHLPDDGREFLEALIDYASERAGEQHGKKI